MSGITLSKAVRSNLLNLQSTAGLLSKSQERLSSGLRVNSALDNPTNFFTAQGLTSRANDLSQLADAVSNAVQTVAAADKGLTAITKLVESAQATARQALQTAATVGQPASLATVSTSNTTSTTITNATPTAAVLTGGTYANINVSGPGDIFRMFVDFDGGPGSPVSFDAGDIADYNTAHGTSIDAADVGIQDFADIANELVGANVTFAVQGNHLTLTSNTTGAASSVTIDYSVVHGITAGDSGFADTATASGTASGGPGTNGNVVVNGETIALANGDNAAAILLKFQNAATASSGSNAFTVDNASGVLTLTGTDGNDLAISGTAATLAAVGLSVTTVNGTPGSGGANPKRAELVSTYNDLLSQIDALAKDSGFNGVNLLDGDDLTVLFNEDGTSKLDIEGVTNNAAGLGLTALASTGFDTNNSINSTLDDLKAGIDKLRTQASKLGANLSVVETRQQFTANMIDVLTKGASNLTLSDANGEAANVLALQTRQQLSSTALSLASQADQNVLRLF